MLFVTGDCHGHFEKLSSRNFPQGKCLTKEDYVLVTGDFGYWQPGNADQIYWFKWLADKPWTTLFVDGNHCNFDALYALSTEKWHGGMIHKINDSIYHLMRGQVFEIDGHKIFTFGGASSHDISDGILEPTDTDFYIQYKALCKRNALFRVNHFSWWKEEMPSAAETDIGLMNLILNNWKVDYVFTHCCASSTQALFSHGLFEPDELTNYFDNIRTQLDFRRWYFGHYHGDRVINDKEIMIYDNIERLW